MAAEFRGRIAQDIGESVPDWEPHREPQPAGIRAAGGIRHQYGHAIDIVPTLYDLLGKDNGLTVGSLALRVDDREAGTIRIRTQPGMFACDGEGLCVGRDSGQAVSADYDPPFRFLGGTIRRVLVDVSGRPFADLEKEATGAFMRD